MAKEKISVRLDSELLNLLDQVILGESYDTLTSKLEAVLQMNALMYNSAMKSIKDMFTELEAYYLFQAFNGCLYRYDLMAPAKMLYFQVEEFYNYGSMGFFTDQPFEPKELLEKLKTLSDMQAWTVINSILTYREMVIEKGPEAKVTDLLMVRE